MTTRATTPPVDASEPRSKDRQREDASFRALPSNEQLSVSYTAAFAETREHIRADRLRVVRAANAALVLLYWDIGRPILCRQEHEGRGVKAVLVARNKT